MCLLSEHTGQVRLSWPHVQSDDPRHCSSAFLERGWLLLRDLTGELELGVVEFVEVELLAFFFMSLGFTIPRTKLVMMGL